MSKVTSAERATEHTRADISASRVVGCQIAVMFMGATLVTPLYQLYQREFGFSAVTLTLVYAVYVVGNLGALFFFGRLSDQIGRRRVSLSAMGLAGIAALMFLCATSAQWLFVARILSGLAIGIAVAAATAWATELLSGMDKARASALATTANFIGLAVGSLLAGLVAQYVPAPLHTTHVVYLVLLVLIAWRVFSLPETVRQPVVRLRDVSLRPRLGVPRSIRRQFISPALTAFATFALVGYYSALVPSLLSEDLGVASLATAGMIVAWLFAVAAGAVMATRGLASRTAMLAGLVSLIPSIGLLLLAQATASITAFVAGTTLGGVAVALGYRGTLQVVNTIAPADRRAEVVASYMIACFLGNSLPVIGIGVLTQVAGSLVASQVFAAVIAGLILTALAMSRKSASIQ